MPELSAELPDILANASHTEYPNKGADICAEISGSPPPILGAGLGVGGACEPIATSASVL